MTTPTKSLRAMIMAGGGGTRFWPRSRQDMPKQFLAMRGDRSLLQETADRLEGLVAPRDLMVVTGQAHVSRTREQLPEIPADMVIGEPTGRDTAPCVALAAALLARTDPDGVFFTCPADHVIEPAGLFRRALQAAAQVVEEHPRAFVTIGVPPTFPSTGYGYIQRGQALPGRLGVDAYRVRSFREKPPIEVAREYVANGEYLWNAGIFAWKPRAVLDALAAHKPALRDGVLRIAEAWDTPQRDSVMAAIFPTLEKVSIDYALLEKHDEVVVLGAPFQWDDVGSWLALERLNPQDIDGNTIQADHVGIRTRGCVVVAPRGRTIATLGVENLLIIEDGDCLLIARKEDESAVKEIVEELRRNGRKDRL